MPAQIWRISAPISTVSFSSLSAPTMRSAVLICPTRISTLAKSSMPIFSGAACGAAAAPEGEALAAGLAAGTGFNSSFAMASILSIASFFSTRGKSAWALPSLMPGVNCPQRSPSSSTALTEPGRPRSAQIFAVQDGKTGCASTVTMRSSSAVVHKMAALRACSGSEFPSAQGCSVVRYLSAEAITAQIDSRARVKLMFS